MDERRRHARYHCRLPCEVCQGKKHTAGSLEDISLAGLSLCTELPFEQGDSLRIVVQPRSAAAFEIQVLVWNVRRLRKRNGVAGWRLGMMLADPSDRFAELVRRVAGPAAVRRIAATEPSQDGKAPAAAADAKREPQPGRAASQVSAPLERRAGLGSTRWFRARVKQVAGRRVRVISVVADCEESARELASREIGAEWTVLELKSV